MKTFMKWAGNKSSIVDLIQPHLMGNNLIEMAMDIRLRPLIG